MKKNSWIIVENKATYLFLLVFPIGISKIIYDSIQTFGNKQMTVADYGFSVFLMVILMIGGLYFFVKFNTYSAWMNPNHPKPSDLEKKS